MASKKPLKTVQPPPAKAKSPGSTKSKSSSANKPRYIAKGSTPPPGRGLNPLVYVIGGAAVLAIIVIVVFVSRNQTSPDTAVEALLTSTSVNPDTNNLKTIVAMMTAEGGASPTPAPGATAGTGGSGSTGAAVSVLAITPVPNPTSFNPTSSPCASATAPTAAPPANAPKQFSAPQVVINPTHVYCAFITTAHGVIVLELFPKSAPQHVNSFVFLASQGFYDNLTWHRVLPGFMAQTGDPLGTGAGGPGYTIPLEIDPALHYDKPGVLGMARTSDPNSAGSQFFITYGPAANLDGGYTIFGQVVKGQDVLNAITPRDPSNNPTTPGDALISIRTLDVTAGK